MSVKWVWFTALLRPHPASKSWCPLSSHSVSSSLTAFVSSLPKRILNRIHFHHLRIRSPGPSHHHIAPGLVPLSFYLNYSHKPLISLPASIIAPWTSVLYTVARGNCTTHIGPSHSHGKAPQWLLLTIKCEFLTISSGSPRNLTPE